MSKTDLRKRAKKIDDFTHRIDKDPNLDMKVPVKIFGNDKIYNALDDGVFQQIVNVSKLPGVLGEVMTMPDAHWGYGFPIGGVAAFDYDEGVISPGGIGFDINCGMRLVTTNLTVSDVKPRIKEIMDRLYNLVPTGVGKKGFLRPSMQEFRDSTERGVEWCIENGYGWEEDEERHESKGRIDNANFDSVSEKARKRGINQLGTLGSGNHYLEVQRVNQIIDPKIAKVMGINDPDQIVIMIHCGSRGFGHQIASDYLKSFLEKMGPVWNIKIHEKELAAAPIHTKEGLQYYEAMACAANSAFVNRQIIMHQLRKGFEDIFKKSAEEMEMSLVYDVAHNIAKIEEYEVEGKTKKVMVHRKGATRSFGPNAPDLPSIYKNTGQPVIIGGSMETGSYLLVGTECAMKESFGSTAHGSGRTMSRSKAKRQVRGEELKANMLKKGIYVKAASMAGLAEEAGFAYKEISDVVDSLKGADLSRRVAQLVPIGNIKG